MGLNRAYLLKCEFGNQKYAVTNQNNQPSTHPHGRRLSTVCPDWAIFVVTNFVTRLAQIFGGYFEKRHFLNKNYCAYFLGNF